MKIKLSKSNWKKIGRKTGWFKSAQSIPHNVPSHLKLYYKTSYTSSKNANPDILTQILSLGNNDFVSCCAASNPNCPKEILIKILKRGNDHPVSQGAASNPNCPPEMLTEILKRGNDHPVSQYAAENPNCPLRARLQWMMDTNQIYQEDSNVHEEEQIDKIDEADAEDPDLIKFKQLLDS